MFKFAYNFVTFMAALVILGAGGWCAWQHKDVWLPDVKFGKQCGCFDGCTCKDCKCNAKNRCSKQCHCGENKCPMSRSCQCDQGKDCVCGASCSCKDCPTKK